MSTKKHVLSHSNTNEYDTMNKNLYKCHFYHVVMHSISKKYYSMLFFLKYDLKVPSRMSTKNVPFWLWFIRQDVGCLSLWLFTLKLYFLKLDIFLNIQALKTDHLIVDKVVKYMEILSSRMSTGNLLHWLSSKMWPLYVIPIDILE